MIVINHGLFAESWHVAVHLGLRELASTRGVIPMTPASASSSAPATAKLALSFAFRNTRCHGFALNGRLRRAYSRRDGRLGHLGLPFSVILIVEVRVGCGTVLKLCAEG